MRTVYPPGFFKAYLEGYLEKAAQSPFDTAGARSRHQQLRESGVSAAAQRQSPQHLQRIQDRADVLRAQAAQRPPQQAAQYQQAVEQRYRPANPTMVPASQRAQQPGQSREDWIKKEWAAANARKATAAIAAGNLGQEGARIEPSPAIAAQSAKAFPATVKASLPTAAPQKAQVPQGTSTTVKPTTSISTVGRPKNPALTPEQQASQDAKWEAKDRASRAWAEAEAGRIRRGIGQGPNRDQYPGQEARARQVLGVYGETPGRHGAMEGYRQFEQAEADRRLLQSEEIESAKHMMALRKDPSTAAARAAARAAGL